MNKQTLKTIFAEIELGYKSNSRIARENGISEITVRRYKIDGYEATMKKKIGICQECGKEMFKYIGTQKYHNECAPLVNIKKRKRSKKLTKKQVSSKINSKLHDIFLTSK